MKNAILATGAALLIAVLMSSPTFAQTSNQQPANAAPAPAPVAAPVAVDVPAADTPIDELLDGAIMLDRAELIRRCAGPPPRPFPTTRAEQEPASEPATIAAH